MQVSATQIFVSMIFTVLITSIVVFFLAKSASRNKVANEMPLAAPHTLVPTDLYTLRASKVIYELPFTYVVFEICRPSATKSDFQHVSLFELSRAAIRGGFKFNVDTGSIMIEADKNVPPPASRGRFYVSVQKNAEVRLYIEQYAVDSSGARVPCEPINVSLPLPETASEVPLDGPCINLLSQGVQFLPAKTDGTTPNVENIDAWARIDKKMSISNERAGFGTAREFSTLMFWACSSSGQLERRSCPAKDSHYYAGNGNCAKYESTDEAKCVNALTDHRVALVGVVGADKYTQCFDAPPFMQTIQCNLGSTFNGKICESIYSTIQRPPSATSHRNNPQEALEPLSPSLPSSLQRQSDASVGDAKVFPLPMAPHRPEKNVSHGVPSPTTPPSLPSRQPHIDDTTIQPPTNGERLNKFCSGLNVDRVTNVELPADRFGLDALTMPFFGQCAPNGKMTIVQCRENENMPRVGPKNLCVSQTCSQFSRGSGLQIVWRKFDQLLWATSNVGKGPTIGDDVQMPDKDTLFAIGGLVCALGHQTFATSAGVLPPIKIIREPVQVDGGGDCFVEYALPEYGYIDDNGTIVKKDYATAADLPPPSRYKMLRVHCPSTANPGKTFAFVHLSLAIDPATRQFVSAALPTILTKDEQRRIDSEFKASGAVWACSWTQPNVLFKYTPRPVNSFSVSNQHPKLASTLAYFTNSGYDAKHVVRRNAVAVVSWKRAPKATFSLNSYAMFVSLPIQAAEPYNSGDDKRAADVKCRKKNSSPFALVATHLVDGLWFNSKTKSWCVNGHATTDAPSLSPCSSILGLVLQPGASTCATFNDPEWLKSRSKIIDTTALSRPTRVKGVLALRRDAEAITAWSLDEIDATTGCPRIAGGNEVPLHLLRRPIIAAPNREEEGRARKMKKKTAGERDKNTFQNKSTAHNTP